MNASADDFVIFNDEDQGQQSPDRRSRFINLHLNTECQMKF
ncbi:unnamed protein product [Acanthoscelides obtectus]|uniref:Uncharacterized protein n=1 Tax=Acanthoscelides obtectus TaxID=200917 RepID=A0A9P0KPT4_ACAOB|nr:unnamed protein product [Acanthoscelides obtectus]CAK1670234.1 hypothetical protein AOBTE_LOCUS27500 [Acanthoscelides obtectus]